MIVCDDMWCMYVFAVFVYRISEVGRKIHNSQPMTQFGCKNFNPTDGCVSKLVTSQIWPENDEC